MSPATFESEKRQFPFFFPNAKVFELDNNSSKITRRKTENSKKLETEEVSAKESRKESVRFPWNPTNKHNSQNRLFWEEGFGFYQADLAMIITDALAPNGSKVFWRRRRRRRRRRRGAQSLRGVTQSVIKNVNQPLLTANPMEVLCHGTFIDTLKLCQCLDKDII